ncbi:MAG: TIM barrel protein [Geminicoccaceae bacterium]
MSIEPAFLPGLCSVTFRSIDAEQVIALAVEAGARGIEWCSTVHVPPGHLATAMRIAAQCRDAGLDLPSYGTYLPARTTSSRTLGAALDTAAALGAPNVRVWAGRQGSGVAGEADRARVADAIRAYAALAAASGITLSIEYHRATLTDTLTSTLDLLRRIDHPNCYAYWQPEPGTPLESAAAELRARVGPVAPPCLPLAGRGCSPSTGGGRGLLATAGASARQGQQICAPTLCVLRVRQKRRSGPVSS